MKQQFKTLGQPVREFVEFEMVDVKKTLDSVEFVIDDVTSLCPVTGQPDYQNVTIEIEPDGVSVETKTLKLYLETFRNQKIFCEDLADKICVDLFAVLDPEMVQVRVSQRTRGGIRTTATASLYKKLSPVDIDETDWEGR